MKFKRFKRLLLSGIVAMGGVGLAFAATAEPLKIGFVYVGPVSDHGWTYRHDVGREAIEKELGDQVETTFVESVAEGADAERVIRQLANDGNKLIFTTSFGFMNPTIKVARDFPDVKFEHATGFKRSDNVSTYMARFYEGRYVAGIIAANVTKSGTIGYVGSFPIPEVVRGINAFTIALRKVNPEAEVKVVWLNTWYDPGKEADAVKTLIDQGADVILQHTDSPAPLQVAEERGVFGIGQASDMSKFAPTAQLTAIIDNWDSYYVGRAKAVIDGTWTSSDTWGGLDTGLVEMASFNESLDASVAADAQKALDAIIAGTLHPFTGPISDQDGKEVVAADAIIEDEILLGMDWYVEGVIGKLPK